MFIKYVVLFATLIGARVLGESVGGYLHDEEIALFHQQGFFLKKQCFTPSQVEVLDQITTAMLDRIYKQAPEHSNPVGDMNLDGSAVIYKKSIGGTLSVLRVVGCGGMEPQVLSFLRSDHMVHTFFDLLGCEQIEHLICQFHPKQPGDGVSFVQHRDIEYRKGFDPDWQDVLGNGSYAIGILAIDPMSADNGGLFLDRGSYPDSPGKRPDIIAVDMEPGDLLFMHPELLHWSGPNESAKSRRTLLTGFCAWGANHRKYPGSGVNMKVSRASGAILMEPINHDDKEVLGRDHNH
ncbi:MAG: phytanoyl-CoA dioxygenase family protein [Chlamydiia bacterium]